MEQQCNNPSSSSSKADRKTIEKNRRNQMKALYLKLHSLVPHPQLSREVLSLPDQLEEAISYIKRLQIDLERMTQKKDSLKSGENTSCGRKTGLPLPQIEIHTMDSALQVVLTTGLDYQFIFTDVIRLLHEESVQVINASYTIIGDTIVHSIHSKMGERSPDDQYGAARISERLKKFVGGC